MAPRICSVAFALLAVVVTASAQPVGRLPPDVQPLALSVALARPQAPFYAPPGIDGADVVYSGEPLALNVSVLNQGDTPATIVARGTSPGIVVRLRREGVVVRERLPLDDVVNRVRFERAQQAIWEPRMTLAPGESIRWTTSVDTQSLAPGLYQVQAVFGDTDEAAISYVNRSASD